MNKREVLKGLLDLADKDLAGAPLDKLRDFLGTLRYATRQVEREINKREKDSQMYMHSRNSA